MEGPQTVRIISYLGPYRHAKDHLQTQALAMFECILILRSTDVRHQNGLRITEFEAPAISKFFVVYNQFTI